MAVLSLLDRQRTRERGRPRGNVPGNYVVIKVYAHVYSITFAPTPSHYKKFEPYVFPYPKAFGYVDNPPLDPPLVPVGSVVDPNQVSYASIQAVAPPVLPEGIPEGSTPQPVVELPPQPGSQGRFIPGTSPKQIFASKLAIRSVRIKAFDGNAANIWWGYDPSITADNAMPILPGSGDVIIVSDLSSLWWVAENLTDKFYFAYEV